MTKIHKEQRPGTTDQTHMLTDTIIDAQAKYSNGERSAKLPADNMWDNETFRQDNQQQHSPHV